MTDAISHLNFSGTTLMWLQSGQTAPSSGTRTAASTEPRWSFLQSRMTGRWKYLWCVQLNALSLNHCIPVHVIKAAIFEMCWHLCGLSCFRALNHLGGSFLPIPLTSSTWTKKLSPWSASVRALSQTRPPLNIDAKKIWVWIKLDQTSHFKLSTWRILKDVLSNFGCFKQWNDCESKSKLLSYPQKKTPQLVFKLCFPSFLSIFHTGGWFLQIQRSSDTWMKILSHCDATVVSTSQRHCN